MTNISSNSHSRPRSERPIHRGRRPEDWSEGRLDMDAGEGSMGGIVRKIDLAIVDSGVPEDPGSPAGAPRRGGHGHRDRDDDGHASCLAARIRHRHNSPLALAIHPIKFFSAQGWPRADRGAQAIREAATLKPSVVVLAWDVAQTNDALEEAIRELRDIAVVVVAAGNWSLDNDRHPNWPANYGDMPHVLTVMATDERDERASYSSYGRRRVYVAAPGYSKIATAHAHSPLRKAGSLRDASVEFRGTSAAAAHVARLAALVRLKRPELNPQLVKEHIGNTARPVKALAKLCKRGAVVDFGAALR